MLSIQPDIACDSARVSCIFITYRCQLVFCFFNSMSSPLPPMTTTNYGQPTTSFNQFSKPRQTDLFFTSQGSDLRLRLLSLFVALPIAELQPFVYSTSIYCILLVFLNHNQRGFPRSVRSALNCHPSTRIFPNQ